jgi:hypothetical protein
MRIQIKQPRNMRITGYKQQQKTPFTTAKGLLLLVGGKVIKQKHGVQAG